MMRRWTMSSIATCFSCKFLFFFRQLDDCATKGASGAQVNCAWKPKTKLEKKMKLRMTQLVNRVSCKGICKKRTCEFDEVMKFDILLIFLIRTHTDYIDWLSDKLVRNFCFFKGVLKPLIRRQTGNFRTFFN